MFSNTTLCGNSDLFIYLRVGGKEMLRKHLFLLGTTDHKWIINIICVFFCSHDQVSAKYLKMLDSYIKANIFKVR